MACPLAASLETSKLFLLTFPHSALALRSLPYFGFSAPLSGTHHPTTKLSLLWCILSTDARRHGFVAVGGLIRLDACDYTPPFAHKIGRLDSFLRRAILGFGLRPCPVG